MPTVRPYLYSISSDANEAILTNRGDVVVSLPTNDERDVIIRLHLSLFGSCYENLAIKSSILYMVFSPLLYVKVLALRNNN